MAEPNNTTGSTENRDVSTDDAGANAAVPEIDTKNNSKQDGVVVSASPSVGDGPAKPTAVAVTPTAAQSSVSSLQSSVQQSSVQKQDSAPTQARNTPAQPDGTAPQNGSVPQQVAQAPVQSTTAPSPDSRPVNAQPAGAGQAGVAKNGGAQRSTPRPLLKCAKCGRDNTPDSKFCRHCGATLARPVAARPAAPNQVQNQSPTPQKGQIPGVVAHANGVPNGVLQSKPVQPDTNGQGPRPAQQRAAQQRPAQQRPAQTAAQQQVAQKPREGSLTPREIDERRARQLLDRALHLAEQKDLHGAVVACRQAIALAPVLPAAYSMLGLLLERGGNAKGAIVAYEKTLQLAPNSPVERDSLMRLRASQAQSQNVPVFHFDDSDLFADAVPSEDDSDAEATADTTHDTNVASVANTQNVSTQVAAVSASPVALTSVGAPSVAIPSMASAPPTPAAALSVPAGAVAAPPASLNIPPQVSPNDLLPASSSTLWRAVKERPSFFMRTLPLLAVMPASLLFLFWARNMAVSRNAPATSEVVQNSVAGQIIDNPVAQNGDVAGTQTATADTNTGNANPTSAATNNASNTANADTQRGAIPITNNWQPTPGAPASPAVPGAPAASNSSPNTAPDARTASRPSSTSSRPVRATSRPVPSIPSPRTDAPGRNEPAPPGDSYGIPPARVLSGPPPVEPIPVRSTLPGAGSTNSDDSGASTSGGGPLGPTGRRGSIRVITRPQTQPAVPAPAAPAEPAIRRSEGSTSDYDRASRLQQRALIQLERGDNAGAISDFRAAISAYNEQIATGVRVAESRNGIASCRSGIQLAQSAQR